VKSPPVEPKAIKPISTSEAELKATSSKPEVNKVESIFKNQKKAVKFKEEVTLSKPAEDSKFTYSYYKAEKPRDVEGGRKLKRDDSTKIRPEDPNQVAEYRKSSMFPKTDYPLKTDKKDEKENWINPFKNTPIEHGLTLDELDKASSYLENKHLKFTDQKNLLELKVEDADITLGYASSLIMNDYDSHESKSAQKESIYDSNDIQTYLKTNLNIKFQNVSRDEKLFQWLKNTKDVNILDAHISPSYKSNKYNVSLSINTGNDDKSLQIKYVLNEKDVKKLSVLGSKNKLTP